MKKTEHLELNQWDPTDRIMRTDFNADNAKIDAALAGLTAAQAGSAGKLELIRDHPANGGAAYSLSMGINFNWADWDAIYMILRYPQDVEGANNTAAIRLGLGITDSKTWYSPNLSQPGYLAVFFPRHDDSANASGFLISDRFIPFVLDQPYQKVYYTYFSTPENSLVALPHLLIYGRK